MYNYICNELSKIEDKIIQIRRDLHQIPELGLELPQTVSYVKGVLESLGLHVEEYINGNGLSAVIEGAKPVNNTNVIGLRADMDGLPIREATALPFASTNGNMHACGHDGHTAILLGAAEFFAKNRDLFAGKIKLIFQPGEEYPGGAKPMIQEGVLENPKVTRMIGFHIGHLDTAIAPGNISYRVGPMMASMDRFEINITGRGYHGAYPEYSNDPIIAANQLITAIQTIKSRNISAVEPAVISVTHVDGGMNQNIIPDMVLLEGTVRTVDNKLREFIESRLQDICLGIGQAFNVSCQLTYDYKYPPVINDETATNETIHALRNHFGEQMIQESQNPLMSGEDFAFYCEQVPSTFMFFANPGNIDDKFHGHHHAKFDIDESMLINVAQAFVVSTLDYLNQE